MGCCCSRSKKQPCGPAPPDGYHPLRTPRRRSGGGSSGGSDDGGDGGDSPGLSDIPTAKPFQPPSDKPPYDKPTPQPPQPALGYPVATPAYPQPPLTGHPPAASSRYPQVPFPDRAIKSYQGSTQPPPPLPQTGNLLNLLD